ncbi:hypothetical protein WOLCODRAFT_158056 [Wolfiporia cocos MD-104 SS10]|uniref:CxC2-like cysteine cluster KDZ transposase-associated domain-containing protein n=1 Tax=Wolfiporia cocos (strain MD-104) TaxID=742152 RepID=A0A2H3J5V4_WOLCO|nr:hypothetical protein WOLCODRAFT_158056 [Wolfiporia cocos MD-104 SS10]
MEMEKEEDDDDNDQGAEAEREEYTLHTESNPFRGTGRNGSMLTVMDMMGIHHLDVNWCGCENSPSCDQQLLAMGLYLASTLQPQTAFTFRVLDDYLLTNKECKTSAVSYYSWLRRVMDNAFPQWVLPLAAEAAEVAEVVAVAMVVVVAVVVVTEVANATEVVVTEVAMVVVVAVVVVVVAAVIASRGSTRGMSTAHRREVIDDHINDSNWKKMTRLMPSLVQKWKKAVDRVISSTNELNDLETTASDTKLAEWRSAAENAQT